MKSSEELMLLLELNNFDITKFKLKKQLEYEDSSNLDLYKYKKYSDLIISHYTFDKEHDYLHRNPLTYQADWGEDVKSLDQFYFTHPDLDGSFTLKEFLELKEFNEVSKESILYDILDTWVEEYREASITKMINLREMINLLPKKNRKYRKPSKGVLLLSILMASIGILLYKNPAVIQPKMFSFIGKFVEQLNQHLYDVPWYSFLGVIAILSIATYAILNRAFSRFIKDVKGEKSKHAQRTFTKWDNDMKKARLKQAGLLEDYVDLVIKPASKTFLDITSLIGPETLMDKFKAYVAMIERKYDWMRKHYSSFMFYLRLLFLFSFILNILFIGVGYALNVGWLNV